jgi:7-cyano-7-deazaguanine synthase in queuosine biosynthesis
VYYDLGQCYAEKEIVAARKITGGLSVPFTLVRRRGMLIEAADGHIPLRNLFLIAMSALDSEGVVFGMLHGEMPEDKNPKFVSRLQTLLQSQFATNIYQTGKSFRIYTPFAGSSKSQMLEWYVGRYGADYVPDTIGCFAPGRACGECPPCFNRWVALTLNRIVEPLGELHPAEVMLRKLAGVRKGESSIRTLVSFDNLWRKRKYVWEVRRALDIYCREKYRRGALRTVWGMAKSG